MKAGMCMFWQFLSHIGLAPLSLFLLEGASGPSEPVRTLLMSTLLTSCHTGPSVCMCRVPVTSKDPVMVICCILFGSKEVTLPGIGTAGLGEGDAAEQDGDGDGSAEEGVDIDDQPPPPALPSMSSAAQRKVRHELMSM